MPRSKSMSVPTTSNVRTLNRCSDMGSSVRGDCESLCIRGVGAYRVPLRWRHRMALCHVRQQNLLPEVQRYVDFYLSHMALEEQEILLLAERVLTAQDWGDL